MTISEALRLASEKLEQSGIPQYRREASSLLRFAINKQASFVIAHPEYQLSADEKNAYDLAIDRRANREPFQYIIGNQEFYGLDFKVRPGVLIPRPETEILVEAGIEILTPIKDPVFYEIGVGSGCISISILHAVAAARGIGVDVSLTALDVAAENARIHDVDSRLDLRRASIFDGLERKFDLIVSNPPYIPDKDLENLQPEVGQFEPGTALFSGADGLNIIRQIIAAAPQFLKAEALILIEIGYGQAEHVIELFLPTVWTDVDFLPDFQMIPRIARARLGPTSPNKT